MSIRVNGADVPAGPRQQQAMLAVLALRAGFAVPLHELVGAVWGQRPPESAVTILRTYAWRLRQRLGSDLVVSAGDGYQLAVPASAVDAHRAEQLAAAAQAHGAERLEERAALLDEAVELWRGEPLAGIPGPFADSERSRLRELHLMLQERRFGLQLLMGRHESVIPNLTAFTWEHPLRERPHGYLMRALYASGRQADALAVFTRAQQVLNEELGLDPGPELRDLHERILANDPDLDAPSCAHDVAEPSPRQITPPPVRVLRRPAQLPPDVGDFSGRTGLVADLCAGLTLPGRDALAVAAVSGMGGIGKTTLALHVAHLVKEHFPEGQLHADLRGTGVDAAEPGAVLGSFLAALGVPGQEIPRDPEDRGRLFRTMLDNRKVLLLLDDARDATQVMQLLPGSAGCAVIVTSRPHLAGLSAFAHVPLEVFSPDEALALLQRITGEEQVCREAEAARELVAACGHLPLAVRIVAARLAARPGWSVADLLARLGDERRRLSELRAGDMSVTAAFEFGHGQLTEVQASVFRSLAPFARSSISLEGAAAALGMAEEETERVLESLVDAALVESPLPGRYRYHDLVRVFALQVRPADPERTAVMMRRLLAHLLGAASSAFQRMAPGDPVHTTLMPGAPEGPRFTDVTEARAWMAAEFDGVVHTLLLAAADRTGSGTDVLNMAADLLIAYSAFGRDVPYARLAATARTVADAAEAAGDDRAAGRALFVCGNEALQATRLAEAGDLAGRAAEASHRAGDTVILYQHFNDLGVIAKFEHRYEDAVGHFDRAVELARAAGHRSGALTSLLNAALVRVRGGHAEEAVRACDEALVALRELAGERDTAHALCVRGQALHALGRYEDALASYRQCLSVAARVRLTGHEARARFRSAETLLATGRPTEAFAEAQRSVDLLEQTAEHSRDHGYALLALARTESHLDLREQAHTHARLAYEVFAQAGLPETSQAQRLMTGTRAPGPGFPVPEDGPGRDAVGV
ncbi:BTAD domain-containing putative transcriptional regulator [Streptomyces sp. NPDC012794]|uniref:AfsR/SARP family transcriptional regulator n=1 Tax=Streptomyces sp. NPDC012794 TaxID=3364850 RepID=UPI0036A9F312